MCDIRDGEIGTLLKGGLVRLRDGSIYRLKDCSFGEGGRLVLSTGEPSKRRARAPSPKKKKYEGKANLDGLEITFLDNDLRAPSVVMREMKEVIEQPPPQPKIDSVDMGVLSAVGATLLFVLKKVSGLDRKLKDGSCAVRHQEAIVRIAKLEGKVLRKQLVDGAKTAKGLKEKWDSRSEDSKRDSES